MIIIYSLLFGLITSIFTSKLFSFNIIESIKLHLIDSFIISIIGYFILSYGEISANDLYYFSITIFLFFLYVFFVKKKIFFFFFTFKKEENTELTTNLNTKYGVDKKVIESKIASKYEIIYSKKIILINPDIVQKIQNSNVVSDIIFINYIYAKNNFRGISILLFISAIIPFYFGSKHQINKDLLYIIGGGLIGLSYIFKDKSDTSKILKILENTDTKSVTNSLNLYKKLLLDKNKLFKIEKIIYELNKKR